MMPCEMKENDISHNQLHSVGMIILKKQQQQKNNNNKKTTHDSFFLIIPDVTGMCEKQLEKLYSLDCYK